MTGSGDLQELTELVADLLGAPATLEDRDFHLVAYAAHGGAIDPVRMDSILHRRATAEVRSRFERYGIARASGPVRIPADPEAGVLGRLCLPVRWRSVTYGYLWLLDDEGRIGDDLLARAAPLAERAGLLMARQSRERADLGWQLADLLSAHAEVRSAAAAALAEVLEPPLVVAVLRTPDDEPQPLNPWLLPRSVLTTTWERDQVLAIPQDVSTTETIVGRARRLLEERGSGPVAAGLSEPCPDLAGVREGWLQARVAARVADGTTRSWPDLGALRLLRLGDDDSLAQAVLTPGISRFLEPRHADLVRTALIYLDHAGSVHATAAALNIHRQTLYHRLRRIEEISGITLSDGRDRLVLHLALTLAPHLAR
ncbi:PucR family transcriptional regulator [Actinomadura logoneensis]|uniref:PucR family transcriptional regulator n=1 Tax=Actinomadura logoneensis TaxID=2293572 RepID=A0A372JQ60_9ACTN|nr:helix-turn-helix domain-containing protein [Actinomadura logoneensis]RFU42153.1 PucR family transcriptional regulator [Actinomadura logoneensis]